ncbi:hypothetical protein NEDG_00551 [Nematocida displodere]|uniref:Uncharacterized protein n=1 Tax=Nematocida displodere TaxID=1805483 RepID=A0A177EC67_9MICR|nr:hypothetical protein NEDG_00551 [Nematocida displodere]
MEEFLKETATLQRILYKSKNAHRNTLYFRKLVLVQRLARKVLSKQKKQEALDVFLNELRAGCTSAYVATSSCLGLGHYLGLSIGILAVVAKIFSLSTELSHTQTPAPIPSQPRSTVVPAPSEEDDEINDIFGNHLW